ncbi:MAG: hypothetical protein QM655_02945 [Nocardioidaceae bacterium]
MNGVFRGVRWPDWFLAGVLTALGVFLMVANTQITDAEVAREIESGSMQHPMSSHSWWMLPVFLVATVAVLWWRRSAIAVTLVALLAMSMHDVLFGWITRCGAGLPLLFVLAFLVAISYDGRRAWLGLGLVGLLAVAVGILDATTGSGVMLLSLPVALGVFVIGRAVRHRMNLSRQLRRRNEELRQLRDDRVRLEVADDRARLSRELDGLLQSRLEQLTQAAESADGLDADQSRQLLADIEADSRRTLDDMREVVGLLRGGDIALAPVPTVAHLDALLARRATGARLTVTGDPRLLPATVELSAYRIVEHLLSALTEADGGRTGVAVDELRTRRTRDPRDGTSRQDGQPPRGRRSRQGARRAAQRLFRAPRQQRNRRRGRVAAGRRLSWRGWPAWPPRRWRWCGSAASRCWWRS